jgi:hypothetical protein
MDLRKISKPANRSAEDPVHMSTEIILESSANGFVENKDEARTIRQGLILPAVARRETVILDFKAVKYATQSFVHALIAEALQQSGEGALQFLEFRNCSPEVRSVIELVVDYSLSGFAETPGA